MNYITVGRFTLPLDLLAAFAAIFIGALIYRLLEKKSIGDWYWNSFFIYIAISKLSYAIFNFNMFIENPFSLLYFNGGTNGQILSFAGIAVYLHKIVRKNSSRIHKAVILPGYFIFLMIYETVLFSFKQNIMAAGVQAVLLIGFIFNHYKYPFLNSQYAILFLMLEALIMSLFSELLAIQNLLLLGLGGCLLAYHQLSKEEF